MRHHARRIRRNSVGIFRARERVEWTTMNETDFQAWISLAWVLASPLVIKKLVRTGRSDRSSTAVLITIGAVYLLTAICAMYLAYEAFTGDMSDASNKAFLFLAAIAPVWILISPFVIYRLFKIKRPEWAGVAILTVAGAVVMDCTLLSAVLHGIAETQIFRN